MAEIRDKEEIAQIFIRNKKSLLQTAYTFSVSTEAAQDLLGDAILAVLERDLVFASERSCIGYLRTTIRNKAINAAMRKYAIESMDEENLEAAAFTILHDNLPQQDVEARMVLQSLLQQYSPQIREAFILYILDDIPVSELAKQYHIKPATLRRQFSRMQARLRNLPEESKKQILMFLFMLSGMGKEGS